MALDPSYTSQQSMPDFEGLDVKEYDLNTIAELLYEPQIEQTHNITDLVPSTEQVKTNGGVPGHEEAVERINPGVGDGSNWSFDNLDVEVTNANWLNMMEETAEPSYDMRAWYKDMYIEEIDGIFDAGYYSFSHFATISDDIGYVCLWDEN